MSLEVVPSLETIAMDDAAIEPAVIYSSRARESPTPATNCNVGSVGCPGPDFKEKLEPHQVQAKLVPLEKKYDLGFLSTFALILNKIIGTGIFLCPSLVLSATKSKDVSLILWLVGCFMTWAGMFIYLEYGIRWPITGGELYYIYNVWTKPVKLFVYIFVSVFVITYGAYNNALIIGEEVIRASSGSNGPVNTKLQKFLAVIIVTLVCQLQAFSRSVYVRTSDLIALFKILVLCLIAIGGLVALSGHRRHGPAMITTPYGRANLRTDFALRTANPFQYSVAMLNIMRAFLGYENANFVLTEIKGGPDGDERRTFRRAVKIAVGIACGLYLMVNVAFFAACTTDEILNQPETLIIFLDKIFGPSKNAQLTSSIVVSISSIGALMALTYSNARVKQEIARLGFLPIPEFWSKTSHRRMPSRALFLHWIFSVLFIIFAPLDTTNGFQIMTTFYSYVHTYINVMLGLGLLCAPKIKAFRMIEREKFQIQSSRLGFWLLGPLTIVYVVMNSAVIVLSWIPFDQGTMSHTTRKTLPYFTGPLAALIILCFGVLWWLWDCHILPRFGYVFWPEEKKEYDEGLRVHITIVTFNRELRGPAQKLYGWFTRSKALCWRFIHGKTTSAEDGEDLIRRGDRDTA